LTDTAIDVRVVHDVEPGHSQPVSPFDGSVCPGPHPSPTDHA
jgi:hypothetical protein